MPKRGENIYKRKDGRWEGRIKKSVGLTDGRKYRSVYGKTYGEVKRKVDAAKREESLAGSQCSLNMEEAVTIWYADKKGYWKESTYAAYHQIVEKYVLPYLGELPLYKIDNMVMGDFAAEISAKNCSKKLSSTYMFDICSVVLRIMSHIQKKTGMNLKIPVNPISAEKRSRIMMPAEKDLKRLESYLLQNIDNDTCLGILAALYTGLRIGELCALTWDDIDLEAGILHVRNNIQRVQDFEGAKKTKILFLCPKTAYSIRDIPIPPVLLHILQLSRKQPAAPFISGARGIWMDPRTLQYRFQKILSRCNIEHFKFHMLRHAFATRCMEKGFDSKSLSEILGHSSIQITLNMYVHSTLKQKRRLMNLIGTYSD